jgi:hypothetical protein
MADRKSGERETGGGADSVATAAFITVPPVPVRMREKGFLSIEDAQDKLGMLARYGRYKKAMIDAARKDLERIAYGEDHERADG